MVKMVLCILSQLNFLKNLMQCSYHRGVGIWFGFIRPIFVFANSRVIPQLSYLEQFACLFCVSNYATVSL